MLEATRWTSAMDVGPACGRNGTTDVPPDLVRRHGGPEARRDAAEAMAREDVVHPDGEPRVRGTHGGRPCAVRRAVSMSALFDGLVSTKIDGFPFPVPVRCR